MTNIARGLHNNHNVYILGAGFSRRRGLPLISDFMVQMRDALEFHALHGHDSECAAIETVLAFRLGASAAAYRVQIDLENIEELFSLASASTGQTDENVKLAIAATLDFALAKNSPPITTFNAKLDSFPHPESWLHTAPGTTINEPVAWKVPCYEFVARTLLGEWGAETAFENTFITFNYDTLLEEALVGLDIPFSLGFESSNTPAAWKTQVLKLHGSVNWALPKRNRTTVEVFPSYRDVVDRRLTPQIIPPTWKKDSRGSFDQIWNGSLKALSEATRVIVMGFSIPPSDLHFKYLLAAGLRENYSLREIVFVNPSPGMQEVRQRCENLFANQIHNAAKLRFIESTVEQFCGQGTGSQQAWSIGRPMNSEIQSLYL